MSLEDSQTSGMPGVPQPQCLISGGCYDARIILQVQLMY